MGNILGMIRIGNSVSMDENLPPKPKWVPERDMPNLEGKVVIVTGANVGIGKETAKQLVAKGAKVYVGARDSAKAEAAITELRATQPLGTLEFLHLDLADLPSVKRAAEEFLIKESKLDILFCNAAVMTPPLDLLTKQGYDLQWGTNVLGHYYLIKLLMPAILAAHEPRIILTSSAASATGKIDFDAMDDKVSGARTKKSTIGLYSQSKLGDVILSKELTRRFADKGVVSLSLNPGGIDTELTRHLGLPSWLSWLQPLILYPVTYGAITQLYAGTAPEAKDLNGQYLIPWARIGKANPLASDAALGEKVWDWCEAQVKDL
ncbi:hypothetical protein BKA62DRAFT_703584 [Auriculariales sp. MPI-PUGE-AT-0066]|nr:hypothetical protein BKA62DRAFT_703584 [Auriculariales sp. MPI-PUGE-AT-0066]